MITLDFGAIGAIDMRNMTGVWAKVFGPDFLDNFDGLNNYRTVTAYQLDTNDGVDGTGQGSGAAVWFDGHNMIYTTIGQIIGGTVDDIEVYDASDVDSGYVSYQFKIYGLNVSFATVPVGTPGALTAYYPVLAKNLEPLYAGQSLEILGNAGSDHLVGGALADKLGGYAGKDWLKGNDGNDSLYGGVGDDTLIGGAGADKFEFNTASNAGTDTIVDFKRGQNDKIVLDDDVFTKFTGKAVVAGNIDVAGDSHAQDANDFLVYKPSTGALFYDADGAGGAAAVQFAILSNHPTTLIAADFLVVG